MKYSSAPPKFISNPNFKGYLLLVLTALTGFFLGWPIQEVLVFFIIVLYILYKFPAKTLSYIPVALFALTAFLIAIGQKEQADGPASLAFITLIFTVLRRYTDELKGISES